MSEIADFLGVKDKRRAREHFIDPQLGITLERTIPDKPTSRLQKYVAIQKGTSQNWKGHKSGTSQPQVGYQSATSRKALVAISQTKAITIT